MEKMEKKDLKKSAECLCFFILMDTLKENQRTREKSSDSQFLRDIIRTAFPLSLGYDRDLAGEKDGGWKLMEIRGCHYELQKDYGEEQFSIHNNKENEVAMACRLSTGP